VNPPNPIEIPDEGLRGLLGGPLRIELRGYEVAKLNHAGVWEEAMKFRPNNGALALAIKEAIWLNRRYNQRNGTEGDTYRVRAVVSLDPGVLAKPVAESNQLELPLDGAPIE
jgi:hypothetical protein